jgi:PAS domain-containing protein
MTPESRRHAETTVLPDFFRNGFCDNIPYRFVRRDGTVIDILLSAIADRDPDGRIARTLAVCVDVTERRQAEEELGRYTLVNSRFEELFGQSQERVRGRTDREILPAEVAKPFRERDGRVLADRRPVQLEERIAAAGRGPHIVFR